MDIKSLKLHKIFNKKRANLCKKLYYHYNEIIRLEDELINTSYQYEEYDEAFESYINKHKEKLTEREMLILQLKRKGMNYHEIAKELGLAYGTVRNIASKIPKEVQ